MVLAAKGDGVLRTVEVGWCGLGDGEDFPAFPLALSRGHARRWPSKDEEGVLHRGELVISTFAASILLLVLVAMHDAVVVLLEHLALLEGMVDRALVVRARLLKHVVELATTASRGASRSLAVWAAAKASSESSACPDPRRFGGAGFFPFLPRFCFLAGAPGLTLLPSAGASSLRLLGLSSKMAPTASSPAA